MCLDSALSANVFRTGHDTCPTDSLACGCALPTPGTEVTVVQSQSVLKDNARCETRYAAVTGPGTYGPFPVPAELHTIGLHSGRERAVYASGIDPGRDPCHPGWAV